MAVYPFGFHLPYRKLPFRSRPWIWGFTQHTPDNMTETMYIAPGVGLAAHKLEIRAEYHS